MKYSWMFLNDSFFDKKVLVFSPTVIACACIYLGKKSYIIYHDRKYINKDKNLLEKDRDKWWTKLGINDDILFSSISWISDISFSIIRSGR